MGGEEVENCEWSENLAFMPSLYSEFEGARFTPCKTPSEPLYSSRSSR